MQGYTFALTGHVNHRLTSSGTTRARLLLETEENFNGLIYKTRLYSHVRSFVVSSEVNLSVLSHTATSTVEESNTSSHRRKICVCHEYISMCL